VSAMLVPEHGDDSKIQGWHRDRLAVVRQSSRQQVADHGESTRLQYGLAGRAVALGWPESRVMVIDEDLGRSAAGAASRPGFARLVAELTMGHVGLVLGLEMSRLARAGRDWHQLIELCSLAGALPADADGVYDPNEANDRLLLGLKGKMRQVELHLIKQRMTSGRPPGSRCCCRTWQPTRRTAGRRSRRPPWRPACTPSSLCR
jgi:DNA invertase Pin-like site-specific DNA recombinase